MKYILILTEYIHNIVLIFIILKDAIWPEKNKCYRVAIKNKHGLSRANKSFANSISFKINLFVKLAMLINDIKVMQ